MKPDNLITYLRRNQAIALLALTSSISIILVFLRIAVTQHATFTFLIWNLFLAWIPLLFIKLVWELDYSFKLSKWLLGILLFMWLLFFPNAPYIITDLLHLRGVPDHLVWYDSIMIFSFAFSGFITGLYSVRIVYRLLSKHYQKRMTWPFILSAFILSGFGIFLGRFGRWNSWDIVTQPHKLANGIFTSLQNPLALKHTAIFSFVLMLLYFAFHIFAEIKQHESTHKYS